MSKPTYTVIRPFRASTNQPNSNTYTYWFGQELQAVIYTTSMSRADSVYNSITGKCPYKDHKLYCRMTAGSQSFGAKVILSPQ